MASLLQDEEFLAPRRRLHHSKADLAALGLTDRAMLALPRCLPVALRDAAEALGSLHVMEGSTLGGQLTRRNVERCIPDGLDSCSYFTGYGARTGTMWRSFLARLEDAPLADVQRIGQGSVSTFERLGSWLVRRCEPNDPPDTGTYGHKKCITPRISRLRCKSLKSASGL